MLKQVISGFTHAPGAPSGWNPKRDGECGALPIRVTLHPDGSPAYCESAWEPTPSEMEMLRQGGKVVLRVVGWQVPVALFVEPPLPEDAPCPAPTR